MSMICHSFWDCGFEYIKLWHMTFTTIQLINEVTHVIETYPNNMFFPQNPWKKNQIKASLARAYIWRMRNYYLYCQRLLSTTISARRVSITRATSFINRIVVDVICPSFMYSSEWHIVDMPSIFGLFMWTVLYIYLCGGQAG